MMVVMCLCPNNSLRLCRFGHAPLGVGGPSVSNPTTLGTTMAPQPPNTPALGDLAEKAGANAELDEGGGGGKGPSGDRSVSPRDRGRTVKTKSGNPRRGLEPTHLFAAVHSRA